MKKHYSQVVNWMIALAAVTATPSALAIDVKDEAGLKAIANDLAGEYTLTADITLSGEWTPIGSNEAPFTGKINGNGHVIKNLSVQNKQTARGAFINSAQGATITKLGLENVNIVGNEDVGGIIGKDKGNNTISECFVTGYLSGRDHVGALIGGGTNEGMSAIENCYALAYIDNYECQGGGLVGTPVDLEIANSYFAGTVYVHHNCLGGIASLVDGGTTFTIDNCFVASPLMVKENDSFGGKARILGSEGGVACALNNNYALAGSYVGPYGSNMIPTSEDATSAEGADKTFAELTDPSFITGTLGWDSSTWTSAAGVLPHLSWQKEAVDVEVIYRNYNSESVTIAVDQPTYLAVGTLPGAVYTSSNPQVATVDENGVVTGLSQGTTTITVSVPADATHKGVSARAFEVNVVGVSYSITTPEQLNAMRFDLAGEFTLEADIDLADFGYFEPIGSESTPFTGKLNGNGHVIKNLNIAGTNDNIGFFGTAVGATISKVGFENANVIWSGDGGANVAVVVGRAVGVTITESYVGNSYVYGRDHVASFVGGSFAGGDVTLIEDCYSSSYIRSSQYQCGGIMGTMINAHINRCHFSGIADCSGSNVGAFVSLIDGDADLNSITNSVCLAISINGNSTNSGRIIGNTGGREYVLENNYGYSATSCSGSDDETNATVTGTQGESVDETDVVDSDFYAINLEWDMENTWQMLSDAYPVLKWQTVPVVGQLMGLPESITLIEGKGNFALTGIAGNLGQTYSVEEVETDYLRIRANISVKTWPSATTTTIVRFTCDNPDVECMVDVPVTIIPSTEAVVHVSTLEELIAINDNLGLDYVLDNDIDMKGIAFNGIGSYDAPYTGIFDGAGYSIKNISRVVSGNKHGALFNATQGAVIKNLGLQNISITGGNQDVAGMVGHAQNTAVEQCFVVGYVQGSDHVGGFFGNALSSSIKNCYVNGSIITNNCQVGGIAGVAAGLTVENCYVTGESKSTQTGWSCRAAGVIGMVEGAGCTIDGTAVMSEIAGGIIGRFVGTVAGYENKLTSFSNNVYSVEKSYTPGDGNDADNTAAYETCTIVDDNGNDWNDVLRVSASDARSEAELTKWSLYAGLGWSTEVWTMPEDGGYPVLKAVENSGVQGIVENAASDVQVYGTIGAIVVDGIEESVVSVYNFSGLLIGQYQVNGSTTIELPASLYIVNVKSAAGVKAVKVLVR